MYSLIVKSWKKDKYFFIYYLAILCATILVSKPDINFGNMVRLGYLCLVFLPLFFYVRIAPLVLTTFIGISYSSFAPMLPSSTIYYFIIIIISLRCIKINNIVYISLILLYFLGVELLYGEPYVKYLSWMLISFTLVECVRTKEELYIFAHSFPIVSIVMSLLFLMNYNSFVSEITLMGDNMEQSSWINPNVFGGYLGCGLVISFYLLLNIHNKNKFLVFVYVLTIILSTIVLIMNASRGVVLSATVSVLILILSSSVRKIYKVIVPLLMFVLLLSLYSNGIFDLLVARFSTDNTVTAGGRTEIWIAKLTEFSDLSMFQQIFGVGYKNCLTLGGGYIDTHNDFLTALFAYGYIGLILFCILLVVPLYVCKKRDFWIILGLEVYVVMEGVVLSPIFRGYFLLIVFYFFISKLAILSSVTEDGRLV